MLLYLIILNIIMKTSWGSKIQSLEKLIIDNLKGTELVEHPHIYHGDLRKKDEPLSLAYKVAEVYREAGEFFDPLIQVFPLLEILQSDYPGVFEIKTGYDKNTRVRTLQFRLVYCPLQDVMQFKYEVLLKINQRILEYLKQIGKLS